MLRNRRSRVLVDHGVQGAIIGRAVLHWLYHSLTAVLLLALLQVLLGGVLKPWSEHWQTVWPLAASVYLSLLLLLPKFIYDWLVFSNRFAGPVMRMRRVLRDVAQGHPYEPIEFRAGDFWKDMAQDLNAAVATLNARRADGAEVPASEATASSESSLQLPIG